MYWGDYLKDTRALTPAQHGAYLLLIAEYWNSGQPLPDDDAALARFAACTPAEWKRIRPLIAPYFEIGEGRWLHRRVDAELMAAHEKYQRRAAAGRSGGLAKSLAKDLASPKHCQPQPEPASQVPTQDSPPRPDSVPIPVPEVAAVAVNFLKVFGRAPLAGQNIDPVRAWLAGGASEAEFLEAARRLRPTLTAEVRDPVRYFARAVPREVETARASAPRATAAAPFIRPVRTEQDWIWALKRFKAGQGWPPTYGPEPGYRGCEAPAALVRAYCGPGCGSGRDEAAA